MINFIYLVLETVLIFIQWVWLYNVSEIVLTSDLTSIPEKIFVSAISIVLSMFLLVLLVLSIKDFITKDEE